MLRSAYPANWRSSLKRLIKSLIVSSFLLKPCRVEDTDLQSGNYEDTMSNEIGQWPRGGACAERLLEQSYPADPKKPADFIVHMKGCRRLLSQLIRTLLIVWTMSIIEPRKHFQVRR